MRDGRIMGVEALIRRIHPETGLIMPNDFNRWPSQRITPVALSYQVNNRPLLAVVSERRPD